MKKEQYDTYIVRIREDETIWRAQITHVGSGRSRFFTNLAQLCLFWHEETTVFSETEGDTPHETE